MCAQKEVYTKDKHKLQDQLEIHLARLQDIRGNRQTSTVENVNDENVWYVALCASIFQQEAPTGGLALRGKDVRQATLTLTLTLALALTLTLSLTLTLTLAPEMGWFDTKEKLHHQRRCSDKKSYKWLKQWRSG